MLLKCILATAALLAASASAAMEISANDCKTVTTDEVKIMSFNVRTSNAQDPCPSGCWEQRKDRVKKMLNKYDPDFIGSQETAVIQNEYFLNTLKYDGTGECAGDCWGNERNSIFYHANKWELLDSQTFALSDTPDRLGSNSWNLEYLRAAVMARFRSKRTSNSVCILNTHYDITRGQDKSSVLVAQRMAEFCEDFDTVVMTGDLNTTPDTAPIKYLQGEVGLLNTMSNITMYETLTAAGAGGNTWIGDSFSSQTVAKKIDYIFARKDAQTCLQGGTIITDAYDGFTSSDHAVVMSTFCIGNGCTACL